MPNRILRDWTDSKKLHECSAEAERLFGRLIMKADDFGRYHANPQLVKSGCFPLAEDLRANTVAAWLTELSDRRLVFSYTSRDRALLAIYNFGQRVRDDVNPKFDAPPGKPERWLAIDEEETRRNPPQPAATRRLVGGGAEVDGVGGYVPGDRQLPTLEMARKWNADWNKNGADYTESELKTAFLALQANGWMWGKNPVVDFRAALERQIQTDRNRKPNENSKRTGSDRNAGTYNENRDISGLKAKVR